MATEQGPAQDPSTSPSRPPAVITPFPTTEKPPVQGSLLSRRNLLKAAVVGGASYLIGPKLWELTRYLWQNSQEQVPSTFDNSLNEGVIGDNNTNHLSLPEINQKFPKQVVEEGSFLYFLSPIVLPDGTRMPYGKENVWEGGGANYPTEELNKEAKEKNIKDSVEFILPAGGILVSPVDGHGYIDMGYIYGHDPNVAEGFSVVFHDKIQNKTYKIWLFPAGKNPNINLVSLVPSLERPADKLGDMNWKNQPRMERGQPLIQATGDQLMRLKLIAFKGEKIDGNATLVDKAQYLVTPRFYTDNEKLVALQK